MDQRPDPLRAYIDAIRAGDRRLASLIAARVFRRRRATGPAGIESPSPAARDTVRRLRDQLGI